MKWANLKILLYLFIGSLAACHPDRSMNRVLDVAGSIVEEEPDTALCILKQIDSPSRLGQREYAVYCLLRTQAEHESRVQGTSDSMIAVALDYFENSSETLLKAKSYYYMGCIDEDSGRDSLAAGNYVKALVIAEKGSEYSLAGKICKSLAGLYQRAGLYDRALEIQQKAYANQLMLEKAKRRNESDTAIILVLIAGVLAAAGMWLIFRRMRITERKLSESQQLLHDSERIITDRKLELVRLEKDFSVLQRRYFECSAVVAKIHAFNDRGFQAKEKPGLSENEWNQFLGVLEETFRFVSRLKEKAPRLTGDDVRICALLREKVTLVTISSVMSMTPETVARRIQRIKSDKMGLNESRSSLESILRRG